LKTSEAFIEACEGHETHFNAWFINQQYGNIKFSLKKEFCKIIFGG
jgi:hypothetical protein